MRQAIIKQMGPCFSYDIYTFILLLKLYSIFNTIFSDIHA